MEGSQTRDLSVVQIWRYVMKRRYTLLAFLVSVVVTVVVASSLQRRVYRSTAVLQVEPEAPKIVQYEDVSGSSPRTNYDTELFYQTQYQILRSRSIAELVIKTFTEEGNEDFLGMEDPVRYFLNELYSTEPVKGSELIRINVVYHDPEKAARLVNLVAETYIRENLERRIRASQAAQSWLQDQIETARRAKESKDVELLGFKEQHGLVSLEEKYNTVLRKLSSFNDAYADAVSRRVAAEGEMAKLEALYQGGKGARAVATLFDDELLTRLQVELAEIDQELNQIKLRYLEQHPKRQRVEAQWADASRKLDAEIARQVDGRRSELQMLRAREAALSSQIDETKEEALELERARINMDILKTELGTDERHFVTLEGRSREIQLSAVTEANNARIVDMGFANFEPVRPRMLLNGVLGLVVGLVGGIALVLVLEYLDNTIKNEHDVEEYLGLPCLGIIPSLASELEGPDLAGPTFDLYTMENPKSTAAECCRSIRTNIQFVAQARGGLQTLLVTSSNQREGKSGTCLRLGISMVQAGQRICLIDSDLRRPRLHKVFGLRNDMGLTSYLAGDAGVDDIIHPTPMPGLFLVPSGPLPPNPAELLQTPKMGKLLGELRERFDRIVLDSPPVVMISDAVVLSQMVDGLVFVVKSNQVPRDVIQAAVRRLKDVHAPLIGVIVNDIDIQRGGYGYHYYYHYYNYNYGYGTDEDDGSSGLPAKA